MKIVDVNKLVHLAERASKAFEKIAKELKRPDETCILFAVKSDTLEKPMPKPYGGGSL